MSILWASLAISGWVFAIIFGTLIGTRARRASLGRAFKLRSHVRPYLMRRAREAGVEVPGATEPGVEAIVDDLCQIAEELTRRERMDQGNADTMDMMAVEATQPIDTPLP